MIASARARLLANVRSLNVLLLMRWDARAITVSANLPDRQVCPCGVFEELVAHVRDPQEAVTVPRLVVAQVYRLTTIAILRVLGT
jgi:hypothetical protein